MGKAAFVYQEEISRYVLRPDHPMQPVRLQHTYDLLREYGAFELANSLLAPPRPAGEEELALLHTSQYIEAVRAFSQGDTVEYRPERFGFSAQGDNPIFPGLYEAATLSTGASLVAASMVSRRETDVAFNIAGGLHHALPSQASGFCVFNDPAIAIKQLRQQGLRVAYVDIDAHHGDGVQHAFYDDCRVLTISLHESGQFLFPGTGSVAEKGSGEGVGYSVNVPLYPYTDDDTYLEAFHQVVPPLLRAFAPDVLVTQLGIDGYHTDPLTHLQLTSRGFIQAVQEFARTGLPWLALGGGGYDLGAVARCWTLAYGVMLGVEWPDQVPQEYAQRHGFTRLRDTVSPEAPEHVRRDARRFAQESVQAVKEEVFPIHNLGGHAP